MKKTLSAMLVATLALSAPFAAQAGTFDSWTLNGVAQLLDGGNTLRLTEAVEYKAGSAWAPGQLSLAGDFSIAFSFKLAGGSGADGITLTIQNSDAGKAALGFDGGNLGYQTINHSVAFTYDTFDNGFDTDRIPGQNTSVAVGGDLANGWGGTTVGHSYDLRNKVLYSWVDYSATDKQFKMYLSDTATKPAAAQEVLASYPADLFNGSDVHFGFTGATGGVTDNQDILSVSVTAVPEPSTAALAALGAVGVAATLRRRRQL